MPGLQTDTQGIKNNFHGLCHYGIVQLKTFFSWIPLKKDHIGPSKVPLFFFFPWWDTNNAKSSARNNQMHYSPDKELKRGTSKKKSFCVKCFRVHDRFFWLFKVTHVVFINPQSQAQILKTFFHFTQYFFSHRINCKIFSLVSLAIPLCTRRFSEKEKKRDFLSLLL